MHPLLQGLPLLAAFSGVSLLGALLHQLAWLVASLLINAMFLTEQDQNTLKAFARRGLIGKFLGFGILLFNTALRLLSAVAQTCLLILYSCLPLIVLAGTLSILEQRWGDSVVMVASILNEPTTPLAQSIQTYIKVPLDIFNTIAFYALPIYNLLVYILFTLPIEMFVHFVTGNGGAEVQSALKAFAAGFPVFSQAAGAYVRANPLVCPTPPPTCITISSTPTPTTTNTCFPVDDATVAALCLHPAVRAFDWGPTLEQARLTCFHLLRAVGQGCGALQTFVNLFLFPLSDTYLWQAIGAFLNALLALLVGVPTATAARCNLAGGFATRPAMCTPDFAPAMDFAVQGAHLLGIAIDNLIDMAFLIVMYGNDTPCPSSALSTLPLSLDLDPPALSLFGANSTVLVALSSQWALTDGQHALFLTEKGARRRYYPNLWGDQPINPRFGVAATADNGGLLGCSCVDDDNTRAKGFLNLRCSIVRSNTPSSSLNITWETPTQSQFLTCANVRILVQSIRWPQRRMAFAQQTSGLPPPSPSTTALAADAVVYVIPSCGGKAANPMACFDPTILTLGNCFPFCMALHLSSASSALDFRGYPSWRDGVLLTARDCASLSGTAQSTAATTVATSCSQLQSLPTTNGPTTLSDACVYAPSCTTWVQNKSESAALVLPLSSTATTTHTQYYGHNNIPAFADTEHQVALVLDGQPIVAAGGVVMRLAKDTARAQHYVDFPTLVGDQFNEFTMEIASPAGKCLIFF